MAATPEAESTASLTRAEENDPMLSQFPGFLAGDIASQPKRLQVIDANFVQRLQSLTGGIEVDLGAPLSADDE